MVTSIRGPCQQITTPRTQKQLHICHQEDPHLEVPWMAHHLIPLILLMMSPSSNTRTEERELKGQRKMMLRRSHSKHMRNLQSTRGEDQGVLLKLPTVTSQGQHPLCSTMSDEIALMRNAKDLVFITKSGCHWTLIRPATAQLGTIIMTPKCQRSRKWVNGA